MWIIMCLILLTSRSDIKMSTKLKFKARNIAHWMNANFALQFLANLQQPNFNI